MKKGLIPGGDPMISNQETLNLSPYMAIYDIVVPQDNMLRQINDLVDFSFVLENLKNVKFARFVKVVIKRGRRVKVTQYRLNQQSIRIKKRFKTVMNLRRKRNHAIKFLGLFFNYIVDFNFRC